MGIRCSNSMAVTCLREHCTIKRKTRIDKFHVFDMEQEKQKIKKQLRIIGRLNFKSKLETMTCKNIFINLEKI